jgi:hypothetical protein
MEQYSDCLPSKKVNIDRFKWQGLQEKQHEQTRTWEPSQGFFEDKGNVDNPRPDGRPLDFPYTQF